MTLALMAYEANVINLEEVELPKSRDRKLQFSTAQISPLDQQIAAGFFPLSKPWPISLGTSGVGCDDAGRNYFVFAEGVGGGFASGGTHASEYSFPENILYPLPDASKNSEIAASIISLATAHSAFKDIAQANAGDRVLVLGGNGSVGQSCITVGLQLGLKMLIASREGTSYAGLPGIRYEELESEGVKKLGGRAKIIIDPVGGELSGIAMSIAGPDCIQILPGFSAGAFMPLLAPRFLGGEHRIIGFNLLRRPAEVIKQRIEESIADVYAGRFVPAIKEMPFSNGVEGYRLASTSKDRVVLVSEAL